MFGAPKLLADGYEKLRDRSIRVVFENLLMDPDGILKPVFDYPGIDYDPTLVGQYRDTTFRRMKPSEFQYKGFDTTTIDEWEATFDTSYRAAFAKCYIERLGPQALNTIGTDFEGLVDRLTHMQRRNLKRRGIRDRATYYTDLVASSLEWPFIRRRMSQRLKGQLRQQFYL